MELVDLNTLCIYNRKVNKGIAAEAVCKYLHCKFIHTQDGELYFDCEVKPIQKVYLLNMYMLGYVVEGSNLLVLFNLKTLTTFRSSSIIFIKSDTTVGIPLTSLGKVIYADINELEGCTNHIEVKDLNGFTAISFELQNEGYKCYIFKGLRPVKVQYSETPVELQKLKAFPYGAMYAYTTKDAPGREYDILTLETTPLCNETDSALSTKLVELQGCIKGFKKFVRNTIHKAKLPASDYVTLPKNMDYQSLITKKLTRQIEQLLALNKGSLDLNDILLVPMVSAKKVPVMPTGSKFDTIVLAVNTPEPEPFIYQKALHRSIKCSSDNLALTESIPKKDLDGKKVLESRFPWTYGMTLDSFLNRDTETVEVTNASSTENTKKQHNLETLNLLAQYLDKFNEYCNALSENNTLESFKTCIQKSSELIQYLDEEIGNPTEEETKDKEVANLKLLLDTLKSRIGKLVPSDLYKVFYKLITNCTIADNLYTRNIKTQIAMVQDFLGAVQQYIQKYENIENSANASHEKHCGCKGNCSGNCICRSQESNPKDIATLQDFKWQDILQNDGTVDFDEYQVLINALDKFKLLNPKEPLLDYYRNIRVSLYSLLSALQFSANVHHVTQLPKAENTVQYFTESLAKQVSDINGIIDTQEVTNQMLTALVNSYLVQLYELFRSNVTTLAGICSVAYNNARLHYQAYCSLAETVKQNL